MKKQKIQLSKTDKILLTIHFLSKGRKKYIRFEDLVVALFKRYKEDFHLRGYSKYPDSEIVNKAIYSHLRRDGFVIYGNKMFMLTERGLDFVNNLKKSILGKKVIENKKLSKSIEMELIRIKNLEGFKFFVDGKSDKINDTDFYNYMGVSVKTEKDEIIGKIKTIKKIITDLHKIKKHRMDCKECDYIIAYHDFVINKFQEIINYYKKNN